MDLTRYVNTFGRYLQEKYGERIHKLSVNAAFTCPNRDGAKGIGGCTFCNNRSFSPGSTNSSNEVSAQLAAAREKVSKVRKARKFLAYFQSYSNTYGDLADLKKLYDEALAEPDVIGLCVGTRPDCVPDPVLELLAGYQQQGKEVWLELGLQSSFDSSLERINRGHTFADYEDAVKRSHKFDLNLCTHLIMGLPGEQAKDTLISYRKVLDLGVRAIKVHPLHIVKGTQMAKEWKQGLVPELSMEDYVDTLTEIILAAPDDLLFHRLTGSGVHQYLLAPEWVKHKWDILGAVYKRLETANNHEIIAKS
ncbi:TIGR01212 family radical SAM protein [Sansalvadorimonas sp. 2012CJ34-2]|uniref:TIGR01212 family radical SAM protein n=1 Tax=Parendozoicomonas callyspongiae TaxID=2942213 RepID=A0ABT0PGQ2_9GAMM|nr:TIGR01212 family radical SAM protein [Sansalvadorimonas sp. 2012CJ34-2]MCL6270540.1 TIGR01212 family radical SAM protein [Sansalvadorimonas sp. 2012CJ34-2]